MLVLLIGNPLAGADTWTQGDIAVEVLWQALHLVDWGHTRYIADNPDEYYEINPILGNHPDKSQVDIYMAASAFLHPLVTGLLPRKARILGLELRPRTIWQCISIGLSGGLVIHNFSIGIQMKF